jgi:hypothetical protein
MPSGEIFKDYKEGTLHSGKGGPIVKKKKQAVAIYLSYRRKEGKEPSHMAKAFRRASEK